MLARPAKQRGWNTLLRRYSAELVRLAEHSRSEAMLALAKQEAALAARAQAAMTRAEDSNRAKDEFLAHISHELRTPLNAIIGFSEMIEMQMARVPDSDRILTYARDINSSGWHLNRVVNDLLDYAKFEAGKLELQDEAVDFAKAEQACYTMVKARLEAKGIAFERRFADGLPLLVCDELKLKQILINLLSNAVKFTAERGKIIVEASIAPKSGFVFRVSDTGIGIAPDEIENVFLPFYQLNSLITRKYEGTGLGLPLTKAFVELHGGSISIDSAPGKGTTVTVAMPPVRIFHDQASDRDAAPARRIAAAG